MNYEYNENWRNFKCKQNKLKIIEILNTNKMKLRWRRKKKLKWNNSKKKQKVKNDQMKIKQIFFCNF